MPIKKRVREIMGVTGNLAGRMPWRKEMALAALLIGAPLITGNMEYVFLNLLGLGIGVTVFRRIVGARKRAERDALRQAATQATTRRTR